MAEIFAEISKFCEGKMLLGMYTKESLFKVNITVIVRELDVSLKQAKGYGTSRYRGVFWVEAEKKWRAQFSYKGKRYTIGRFDNELDAAKAYDKKAHDVIGKQAYFNFPKEATKYASNKR